jgi:hypothetical protein
MTLKTQMTNDLNVFFNTDEFAENVTYTPNGGEGTTIQAIVNREGPLQEPYVRGAETATGDIMVQRSQVTTPVRGDKYTFDSNDWYMDADGVTYMDDDVLIIVLERDLSA